MKYRARIDKVIQSLSKESVLILNSSVVLYRNSYISYPYRNNSDFLYLTGLNLPEAKLALDYSGKILLFMKFPDLKIEQWSGKMITPDEVADSLGIPLKNIHQAEKFDSMISKILNNRRELFWDFGVHEQLDREIIRIANSLNRNGRSSDFGPTRFISSHELIGEMRVLKDFDEMNMIRKAIAITADAMKETIRFSRSARVIYEYQIKAKFESILLDHGVLSPSYPTIVGGGNNATYLHYEKCDQLVSPGSLVLIDGGAEWMGYAADITRVFPVAKKFAPAQKEIYNIVLTAQKRAIETANSSSATLEKIHNETVRSIVEQLWELKLFHSVPDPKNSKKMIKPSSVNEVIEKKIYRIYYMHYTSHYLGLDVHDAGKYNFNSQPKILEKGMTFTVEPGLYFSRDLDFIPEKYKGLGIRIEDDILFNGEFVENLSIEIPKEIEELERY